MPCRGVQEAQGPPKKRSERTIQTRHVVKGRPRSHGALEKALARSQAVGPFLHANGAARADDEDAGLGEAGVNGLGDLCRRHVCFVQWLSNALSFKGIGSLSRDTRDEQSVPVFHRVWLDGQQQPSLSQVGRLVTISSERIGSDDEGQTRKAKNCRGF